MFRDTLTAPAPRQPEQFEVLCTLSGSAALRWDGESLSVHKGDSILIPAMASPVTIDPAGTAVFLRATL
jgi:mannose-6-phosphate isomerase class I